MNRNPLVSIIIINWNGKNLLSDCLESLSKVTYKPVEIIFVDNASSDGSLEYVKTKYPHFIIIENKTNLGFAEGHEEAFAKAKGEYVLLLSTDTIVEKNLLNALMNIFSQEKNVGAVMPKLVMYPKTDKIDSAGTFLMTTGMSYHFGREKNPENPLYNKPIKVYSAKGACLLFPKKVLNETGLFDKDYFAYFEESDLCHRIWLAGYSVYYWPYTTVYHKGGGASKRMVSSFIQFHSFKNRLCTLIKNLSITNLFIMMPQILIIYQIFFILRILTGEFGIAFAVQRGIIWNIAHIHQTFKKRRYIQSHIRKVSDKSFFPLVIRNPRISYYYYMFSGLSRYKD